MGVSMSRRLQVLVVDDDPSMLETMEAILSTGEFDVSCSSSAEEGLRLLAVQPFDVVISDWSMPGMGGMALDRQIRCFPWVSCLLVTARADEFTMVVPPDERKRLGILAKPFNPEDLLKRVRLLGMLALVRGSLGVDPATARA